MGWETWLYLTKHCQRHNGPEVWVYLSKVTYWVISQGVLGTHIYASFRFERNCSCTELPIYYVMKLRKPISCISPQVPFRREKESSFYMQNLNKILSLSLHLSRVWRPSPAEERLHNHFLTQKTVTTSPGSWHHSQPSSLLNVTEWVSYWQA